MFLGDLRVHSVPSISVRPLLVLLAALAPCLPVAAVESLHSPDDAVAVSVDLVGQHVQHPPRLARCAAKAQFMYAVG